MAIRMPTSSSLRSTPALALSLWAMVGASACADVDAPSQPELNPFESIEVAPQPNRRLAHIQVVLRSQRNSDSAAAKVPTAETEDPAFTGVALADSNPKSAAATEFAEVAEAAGSNAAPVEAPLPKAPASEDLDVRGDFASFRGVEERLVWAFAGVAKPVWAGLEAGECMAVSASSRSLPELPSTEISGSREIELLDLGQLELQIGEGHFDVPLHLAPGVLPYASGVQYRGAQALSRAAPKKVELRWEGLESLQLPAGRIQAPLLPRLHMDLLAAENETGASEAGWYELLWSPLASGNEQKTIQNSELFLHVRTISDSLDSPSSQVVCRLADRGEWQLDLEALADEGLTLPKESEQIEVELRRVHAFEQRSAGFEKIRVQIERSEQMRLKPALPKPSKQ